MWKTSLSLVCICNNIQRLAIRRSSSLMDGKMHLGVLATLTLAGGYLSLSLPVCISVWFLSFIDCSLPMWGAGTAWKPKWNHIYIFSFQSTQPGILNLLEALQTWTHIGGDLMLPDFIDLPFSNDWLITVRVPGFVLLQKSVKRKCCIDFLLLFSGYVETISGPD